METRATKAPLSPSPPLCLAETCSQIHRNTKCSQENQKNAVDINRETTSQRWRQNTWIPASSILLQQRGKKLIWLLSFRCHNVQEKHIIMRRCSLKEEHQTSDLRIWVRVPSSPNPTFSIYFDSRVPWVGCAVWVGWSALSSMCYIELCKKSGSHWVVWACCSYLMC